MSEYAIRETPSLRTRWRYDVIRNGRVVLHEIPYQQAREFIRILELNAEREIKDWDLETV